MAADGTRIDSPPAAALPFVSHVPALLAYAALTLILTWPLATSPGAWVPHDVGDPLLSTWALWWNATHVPFTSAWWNGAVFYPAPGTLALSDHRVGIGLITTPLILAGVTPLAAHNVAFLLSYFLSATSAYALAFSLTRHRAAAFVAGLTFGFHPFRSEHLPHLELLSSYWLPLVLLALHGWLRTFARRWLVVLVAALMLVAFTTGYYFFFLGVLIGLWLVWFLPWNLPARRYVELTVGLLLPFVPLAPILLTYRAIHQQYGLSRSITEIEDLSADLRGWVTAPAPLAIWDAPQSWRTPEGAVFLGVAAPALVVLGVWAAWRGFTRLDRHARPLPHSGPRPRGARQETLATSRRALGDIKGGAPWLVRASRPRQVLLVLCLGALAVAMVPALWQPVEFALGPLRFSVSQAYKPFSVATLLFLGWVLSSEVVRAAWRAHGRFAFYVLATLAMMVCALGPTARLAGERVLYKAPYAWLMLLPGFADGFRAPARFAMLVALCLAVAAALAFERLTRRVTARTRTLVAAVVVAGVLADSWVYPFPLATPPAPLAVPAQVPADASVLEWPMGVFEDAAAMYHATQHGRPTVNGLSGYAPSYHGALRSAIRDNDTGVLDVIATERPIAMFLAKTPANDQTMVLLPRQSRGRHVATTATHHVFLVPAARRAPAPLPGTSKLVAIAEVVASVSPEQAARVLDGDRRTSWIGPGPQRGGEELRVRLESRRLVAGVVLSQGAVSAGFPRQLTIAVSPDGGHWQTVWQGPTGARTVAAALDDPLDVRVLIEFPPVEAELLRLTQTGSSVEDEWAVAELAVLRP